MLFSILIPTLDQRRSKFIKLYSGLSEQIDRASGADETELLSYSDNGENSIGYKRNQLLARAQGEFIAFVDDDDEVGDDYVALICRALKEHPDVDCIGIKGSITFAGGHSHVFVHSLQYDSYFKKNGIYYRPPYHLNPIRREIALRYGFEEIDFSEDIDWALRLCCDRALKKEFFIDKIIYYYHSRRSWIYQAAIDFTEPVRHALGIRHVNRIRLRRWLQARIPGHGR